MYVNYYDREVKNDDKNETVGEYILAKGNKTIFPIVYKLHMSMEQELIDAV